jgi:hypothetical protein
MVKIAIQAESSRDNSGAVLEKTSLVTLKLTLSGLFLSAALKAFFEG